MLKNKFKLTVYIFSTDHNYNENMNSSRNAIADYLTYILNSTNEHIHLCLLDNEIWASLNQISKIYNEDEEKIFQIIKDLFRYDDYDPDTFSRKIDGTAYYAFDIIIQAGFKIKNQNAIQFRQWATKLLSEYIIKGFALDDKRLKNYGEIFEDSYFVTLQDEYEEIALSKRSFIQKIADLYTTAYDYEKSCRITNQFYIKLLQLNISIPAPSEKKITDSYLKLANKKASAKIPLTMNDWIYYFNPLLNSKSVANITNEEYFSKPSYYENLNYSSCNNFSNRHYENELFGLFNNNKRSK